MKHGVMKSISVVFALSVLAKMIAFVKSIIQASYFGVTAQTDAYNLAFGFVGNVLFMLTTAVSVAYVPIYMQKKVESKGCCQFSTRSITLMAIGGIILTALLELFSPLIIKVVAPGYSGAIFDETVSYFRTLLVGFVFSLVAGIYQNILNAEKIYGFANVSSIVNSVVLILVIVLFAERLGIWALVISVPISYFVQFFVLYVRGRSYGRISFRYGLKDDAIRKLAVLSLPILISQATVEINQVIDRILLSTVAEGAVTAVSYAAVLYQFASSIIGTPISTVMFTELSEVAVKHDYESMRTMLLGIYKVIILVCLPIVVVVNFTSSDIVAIVYGRGNFDGHAVAQTAIGLFGYIYCLLPGVFKSIITRAYYGLNDTKRPMIISIWEVALNILLSVLLVKKFGILGVVGATAIASFACTLVMMIDFERVYFRVFSRKDLTDCWKLGFAMLVSIIAGWVTNNICKDNSFVHFATSTLIIYFVYFIVLFVCMDRQIMNAIRGVKKKVEERNSDIL